MSLGRRRFFVSEKPLPQPQALFVSLKSPSCGRRRFFVLILRADFNGFAAHSTFAVLMTGLSLMVRDLTLDGLKPFSSFLWRAHISLLVTSTIVQTGLS